MGGLWRREGVERREEKGIGREKGERRRWDGGGDREERGAGGVGGVR